MAEYLITVFVTAIILFVMYNWILRNYYNHLTSIHLKSKTPQGLKYTNGDAITFIDAWKGDIPTGSVFSPDNHAWYFDISGLNSEGQVIFSTMWRDNMVMKGKIPKNFTDIKRWQVLVAGGVTHPVPSNVMEGLSVL